MHTNIYKLNSNLLYFTGNYSCEAILTFASVIHLAVRAEIHKIGAKRNFVFGFALLTDYIFTASHIHPYLLEIFFIYTLYLPAKNP